MAKIYHRGMKAKLYLLLAVALGCSGCGELRKRFGRLEKDGHSLLKFSSHQDGPHFQTLSGGVMVYVVGSNFRQTYKFADETAAAAGAAVSVPNGTYNVYVVGYTGANMSDVLRCGKTSVTLTGSAATVSLSMAIPNCDADEFVPNSTFADASYGAKVLNFVSCHSSVSDASLDAYIGSNNCTASFRGSLNQAKSMKISLVGYTTAGAAPSAAQASASAGLSSDCLNGPPAFTQAYADAADITAVGAVGATGVIYGKADGTIKYSTNSGSSFTASAATSLTSADNMLVNGSRVFLSGGGGVKYSDDNGATWNSTGLSGSYWNGLASDGASTIWAGNSTGVVQKSTNGGSSFSAMTNPNSSNLVLALYYDSVDAKLYAGSVSNVAKVSTDGGTTWNTFYTFGGASEVHSFARSGSVFYVGTNNSVETSTDGGSTWTSYALSQPAKDIKIHNGRVYVATSAAGAAILTKRVSEGSGGTWTTHMLQGNEVMRIGFLGDVILATDYGGSGVGPAITESVSTGMAFSGPVAVVVPPGGPAATAPVATKVTYYSDMDCTTESSSFFFPRGIGNSTAAVGGAVTRVQAATLKLFLRD